LAAVLLDRDGVINRELGRPVLSWDEFEFLPGVLDALQSLASLPVSIVVVSNQAAIGRGWVAVETVEDIHQRMVGVIQGTGGRVDDVVYCPHAPDAGCTCRKPLPGLLLGAAHKHGFNLERAVMVGDSHRDVQAAQTAGAIPVLVRSGHPVPPELEERLRGERVPVVADLAAVVEMLIEGCQGYFSGGERN
jgi:D-glycero-D-manno-heptose 1,7-bisphosphate phosphatase